MMSDTANNENYRALAAMSIGFVSVLGPETCLLGFQTSMGVKEGMGSSNVLVYGVCFLISSLVLYEPLIRRFGRKWTLISGEIASIFYTIALYFQSWWTVIPGGALLGASEALVWTSSAAIAAGLGEYERSDMKDTMKRKFISIYLSITALGQAISYLIAEGILNLMDDGTGKGNLSDIMLYNMSDCGAGDCPASYSFQETSPKFARLVPSQVSMRVMLTVFLFLQLAGILTHCLLLPNEAKNCVSEEECDPFLQQSFETTRSRPNANNFNRQVPALNVLKTVVSPVGVLTTPVQLQYGLLVTFIWSEFNRAFVACPLGVEHIGSADFIVDFSSFLICIIIAKYSGKIRMEILFIATMLIEITCYSLGLMWTPSAEKPFVSYMLAVLFGLAHGSRRNVALSIAAVYFTDLDVAYNIQYAVFPLGVIINYSLTNVLCVYIKIFLLIALSFLSTGLLCIASCLYKR